MTRALLLALLAWSGAAETHDAPSGWSYAAWCCNSTAERNGDCAPIPDGAVRITPVGYVVTLNPGDHPLITQVQTWTVPYDSERPSVRNSGDFNWHACLYPSETVLRCLFVPPMGS